MIEFDFSAVLSQWPLLLKGVAWTLGLTAVSTVIGVLVGIACAWARVHGSAWMRVAAGAYVELIRNTPFIVQLFFVFLVCPQRASSSVPKSLPSSRW
jgi:polar amino acid transport system permease protein